MPNGTVSKPGTSSTTVAPTKDAVRAGVISLLEGIPFADDGDGFGMVAAILDANTVDDLMADTGKLPKAADVAGRDLKVREITRRESDIADGDDSSLNLPWYVLVDSTDIATGERVLWQTSAATVITKLAKLHEMNLLPAIVSTSLADKTTKRGYRPVNLTIKSVTQ